MRTLHRGEFHGANASLLALEHFHLTRTFHSPHATAGAHCHELPQVCLVRRGSFDETVGATRRAVQPLHAVIRPAGEAHANRFGAAGAECLTLEIDPLWLVRLENQVGQRLHSRVLLGEVVVTTLADLQSALATPEPERSLAAESALLGLMSAVVRELRAAERGAPRIVSVARDFVAGHLDEKLTIERIAQAAGVHPVHLARTFSSRTRETIGAFVRRLRAERAKQLLKSSSSPLSEVATRCGFSDQSHMGRILRGIYGLTPRQLRGRAG